MEKSSVEEKVKNKIEWLKKYREQESPLTCYDTDLKIQEYEQLLK